MMRPKCLTCKWMPFGVRNCPHSILMWTLVRERLRGPLPWSRGVESTLRHSRGKDLYCFQGNPYKKKIPAYSVHQTHYEQYGDVAGTVTIDGRQFALQTNSVRDHSIAMMRDWRNFHRYIIHFFNLANGDRITVGIVSIPLTFSR